MKKILALSLFTFLSLNIQAAELECIQTQSLEPVSHTTVSTIMGEKTFIDMAEHIATYVTQKSAHYYVLEAFFPEYDMRGYSEGSLREKEDKLVLAIWGRDQLFELTCRLSN